MTWLVIKTFFKKLRAAVVKYWQYVALAISAVVMVFLLRKNKNFDGVKQAFKLAKQSHEEEISVINRIHREEVEKKEKIILDYNKTLAELDDEYKKQNLKLDKWEKKRVKEIVKETYNDPEGRVKKIAEDFGFELVTINDKKD
tara:strand:- start:5840 stop:6268 length:429 start_codon:yes stop_codon:yes gene_type:complete